MRRIAPVPKLPVNGMANAANVLTFTAAGKTKYSACGIRKVNKH
jgi:hypothetical protein